MLKFIKKCLLIVVAIGLAYGIYVNVINAKTVDYTKPSQTKSYPKLKNHPNAWIDVSIRKQRVYIKDGSKVLYTMYCSTGLNNSTPTGTFSIENERGTTFYDAKLNEGANYWTSFKNHGEYLFHTVPIKQDGTYDKAEAKKLGKVASHGCIRLTIPDAKWIYKNIPVGTKVVVE